MYHVLKLSLLLRGGLGTLATTESRQDDGETLRENQEYTVEDVDTRLWELLSG